jgi:hypothetical protein
MANTKVYSAKLVRIAAVRNADNLGGYIAAEVILVLTAENKVQLSNMVNIAAADGWRVA